MIHSLFDDASEEPHKTDEPGGGEKEGFFRRLVTGLSKTRKNLNEGFDRLIGSHAKIDEEFMEELEELLFSADVGADITLRIVSDLKADVKKNLLKDTSEVIGFVKKKLVEILNRDMEQDTPVSTDKPFVILVIGVNGSGKTTTVGKIAAKLNAKGHSVLLAAGDTFRAAAIDQLEEWAKRANADLVRHQAGSDPSAVVFDAYKAAVSRGRDVMIADTAGRLHSKVNLMEELKKIKRIIGRQAEGAPHETLLVLDATTGQNAINQAKIFNEAIGITGIVLTKLDGTAKGGVVINIMDSLKLPVKLIGVGEGVDDLRPFKPDEFIDAIFEGESLKEKTK
ncbi:Signal recognition particle receptor FtsY [hydrothermal vent metagenome]|uniref:Signal recognition particle receptor FtsY n=1 Tax=hydrothermal vent metagenome TaxID=652676 RepID=A0A3B1C4G0_9ZZZZ